MHRLTRQVRLTVNDPLADPFDPDRPGKPINGHAGYPAPRSIAGHFFQIDVTLEGKPSDQTGYLLNIKDIDAAVRARAIPQIGGCLVLVRRSHERDDGLNRSGNDVARAIFGVLRDQWPPATLHSLTLHLTPYLSLTQLASEYPMHTRLSTKFEFSATHRLHNPALSDDENRKCFGKCNNPHGHGHNYELQVTLTGPPTPDGLLRRVPEIEQTVAKTVLDKFDHKNLNAELPEFKDLNPSVENIAMVIYRLLKPHFPGADNGTLASVTVWETPKTWCEYAE